LPTSRSGVMFGGAGCLGAAWVVRGGGEGIPVYKGCRRSWAVTVRSPSSG